MNFLDHFFSYVPGACVMTALAWLTYRSLSNINPTVGMIFAILVAAVAAIFFIPLANALTKKKFEEQE